MAMACGKRSSTDDGNDEDVDLRSMSAPLYRFILAERSFI